MNPTTGIAVFCYKRAGKLKASMEALLKNPECSEMEIVFFCDGAKSSKDEDGVLATRKYIDSLSGFKKISKQYRDRNWSTGPNFQSGLTHMRLNFDQFIVVEDDLVVSPNYIKYILDALAFYRLEKSVFCVTGFAFPLEINDYPYDTVVHHRFCSYGWGSWSDRLSAVKWHKEELAAMMNESPGFRRRLNSEGLDLFRMLKKQIDGSISTWDIQMQVHVSENQMKVIYPILSKTHNIGFDNESTNTFGVDYLKTITDPGEQRSFKFCGVFVQVPFIRRQLQRPYSLPQLAKRKIVNTLIKLTNTTKKSSNV